VQARTRLGIGLSNHLRGFALRLSQQLVATLVAMPRDDLKQLPHLCLERIVRGGAHSSTPS
jgi:hypothetical protein